MKKNLRLKLLLPLLLLTSFPLKVVASLNRSVDLKERGRDAASKFLESNQFTVRSTDASNSFVFATGQGCDVLLAYVSPKGDHRDKMRAVAGDLQLTYLYEGRQYSEQPVWKTRLDYYTTHLLSFFGLRTDFHPTFALVTTPACSNLPFNWEAVSSVPIQPTDSVGAGS